MDRLQAMRTFVEVVDNGSFSAAAGRLGMGKSAVSKTVASLEQSLGARLINRTTRRLHLTEVGELYYHRCVRILEDVAATEAAVGDLHALPRGVLRVNAPLSFGVLHLAGALPAFQSRFPHLDLNVDYGDRFVDLVREGYDVAIRIGRLEDSTLRARRLAPCPHIVCASPAYLARAGTPRRPRDLSEHDCLCYAYQPHPHQWHFRDARGQLHRVRVGGSLRANNGEALLQAALAGQGVILSPAFICARELAAGRLVALLPEYKAHELAIHAAYPFTHDLSAKVRAFVDFLVERFGGEMDWANGGT